MSIQELKQFEGLSKSEAEKKTKSFEDVRFLDANTILDVSYTEGRLNLILDRNDNVKYAYLG